MAVKLVCTLAACIDCIAYVANGDVPDERDTLTTEIQDFLQLTPDQHLAYASGLDEHGEYYRDADGNVIDSEHPEYEAYCEDWFSWSECECCGDFHGGNRNRLAILECVPEHEKEEMRLTAE